jgi:antitoxin component of MazEF toxin-antitoxin module
MEIVVKPKKWGNSLGITIPRRVVEKEHITMKDEIIVDIRGKRISEI